MSDLNHYTCPDNEIDREKMRSVERARVRLEALQDIHCLESLIETLIVQLEERQALYLSLTRERQSA